MQILKKTVKILSGGLDICLLIVCLLLVLLGIYSFIDNAYLFNAATDKSVLYYKPELNEPITEDRLITENQVGWIHIEGTKVDFPVLQGKDNVEYLNKDPYGEFSFSGSIFLDSRNSADFSDDYSVIYGHHMSGGHMFGCLDSFLDEEYFKGHRFGTLATKDRVYDIELFAVEKCLASDPYIFAPGEHTGKVVGDYILPRSEFHFDIGNEEHLIALTTCTDEGDDSRLAVFGCLIERRNN